MRSYRVTCGLSIFTSRFLLVCGSQLELVLWWCSMGVGDGPTGFVGIFSKRPHLRSKVIQGSICLRNALWLPNLARTPDQNIVHCWGHRSCRGHLGSTRVQIINALLPPKLVGRIPDQCIMHCWVKGHEGVSWGQVGSNALWPPNLVGRTPDQSQMHCWGQKSCRGQIA